MLAHYDAEEIAIVRNADNGNVLQAIARYDPPNLATASL